MHFQTGELYHIFNQGNNREKIFLSRDNYIFFLNKIKTHILPYADVLVWCLMPNHFHLMIYVHTLEVARIENTDARSLTSATHMMTSSHRMSSSNANHLPLKQQLQSINQSIAILLRSYTRAINEQESRTGSLFRPHTKALRHEALRPLSSILHLERGSMFAFLKRNIHRHALITFIRIRLKQSW